MFLANFYTLFPNKWNLIGWLQHFYASNKFWKFHFINILFLIKLCFLLTTNVRGHDGHVVQPRWLQPCVHPVMVLCHRKHTGRDFVAIPQQKGWEGQGEDTGSNTFYAIISIVLFIWSSKLKINKTIIKQWVVPDMQPTTLLIPRAFMASRMFLVPSDIMVVGPSEHKSDHRSERSSSSPTWGVTRYSKTVLEYSLRR